MVNFDPRFPMRFIRRTADKSDPVHHVPAPYLRRRFTLTEVVPSAQLLLCGLGFYEVYINGRNITKGPLAPYCAAPDDILYYDRYEIAPYLRTGENVIGLLLGNGYQNTLGGMVWDFDRARGRDAPCAALWVKTPDGETLVESDEAFRCAPSPFTFDDLRYGVHYDARLEIPAWNEPGFDDTDWTPAETAPVPRGEARITQAEPIAVEKELQPVSIVRDGDGWLYDFGENNAGVCRLTIAGHAGQAITLTHGEHIENGALRMKNIQFAQDPHRDMTQVDRYICRGGGEEVFVPRFTYHGFRYVRVEGLLDGQATPALLTYLVMHSDLRDCGGFSCSDARANRLMEITRRSDLSNFYYFPTDCPQREKNGWTADAALSAQHVLMTLTAKDSYREWLHNIRRAQRDDGALPGIIPTTGWGFDWGNGPAWDSVITTIPYYSYVYTGDRIILEENAAAIMRYLHYIERRRDQNGTIAIGLGDWCPVGRAADDPLAPLVFTDTVMAMDIAAKASFIFGVLNRPLQKAFADGLHDALRAAVRTHMVDFGTMTALGSCQTSQAMALYYGVFDAGERDAAFHVLTRQIEQAGGHFDTGVLGARVLFDVLTAHGKSDLAYSMIMHPDYPSYADWITRGATTLYESFQPADGPVFSLNHHFWGDVAGWMIRAVGGIRYNPRADAHGEADIRPAFIDALESASAYFDAPAGRITSAWRREGDGIILTLSMPEGITGRIQPEGDWMQVSGHRVLPAASGTYRFVRIRN